jgi:hypothetical protein
MKILSFTAMAAIFVPVKTLADVSFEGNFGNSKTTGLFDVEITIQPTPAAISKLPVISIRVSKVDIMDGHFQYTLSDALETYGSREVAFTMKVRRFESYGPFMNAEIASATFSDQPVTALRD